MTLPSDPYRRLRPEGPTLPDDVCHCDHSLPIALQDHLTSVPLVCVKCNGEVKPERLGLTEVMAEELADWRNVHRALYLLWRDSGEYEAWAKAELMDPKAPVNVRGLEVVKGLNSYRRAFLWWFGDSTADIPSKVSTCPNCGSSLSSFLNRWVCDKCSILVPDQ